MRAGRETGFLAWVASLGLVLGVVMPPSASAAEGNWLLDRINLWQFAARPNPPPPRPNTYRQDVKAEGIRFSVVVTDPDNKAHPHHLWMGWTIRDADKGAIIKAGHEVTIEVSGRHQGDTYTSADFMVRAGDYPRSHPAGWRNDTETHPAWGFRTDPVLAIRAGNGEAQGRVKVKFPTSGRSDGEPFAILFHTGLTGSVGVEYVYRWSGAAEPSAPKLELPPQVTGAAPAVKTPVASVPAPAPTAAKAPAAKVDTAAAAPATSPRTTAAPPPAAPPATAAGAERRAILDGLRPTVEAALKQPVEFVVERIKVAGDRAFVLATPQRKGGGGIDWNRTICRGDVSHLVGALLKRQGQRWMVVNHALCPTDVAWEDWPKRYGVPAALFE